MRDCGALRSSFGWCFESWLAGWLAERNEWAEVSSNPALGNAIGQLSSPARAETTAAGLDLGERGGSRYRVGPS